MKPPPPHSPKPVAPAEIAGDWDAAACVYGVVQRSAGSLFVSNKAGRIRFAVQGGMGQVSISATPAAARDLIARLESLLAARP